MSKLAATKHTTHVNGALLEQASIHLLAAVGEDVKQVQGSDYLTVMLKVLQARGYTLEEVNNVWNEVTEGKGVK